MADGDFLDLQNQLAAFMGAEDIGNLPLVEQQRVKKVVNQSYRELYSPSDGFRPAWGVRSIGLNLAGEISLTGVFTAGSTEFTFEGDDLKSDYEGSMCFVGNEANRIASVDEVAKTGNLVAPPTASATTVKLNVNSHKLPVEMIDVDGRPERVGWGVLSPMNGADEEARYRSLLGYDFAPQTAFGWRNSVMINSNGDEYNFGEPQFFYVDSATLGYETALARRLVVYPLPTSPLVVRLRGNVLPKTLTADTDRPVLPADVVDDVLLPVARAKLASVDPRYNSQNIQYLLLDAENAKKRMRSMHDSQKVRSRRIRVKAGY